MVNDNPHTRLSQLENDVEVSKSSTQRILKKLIKYCPYKIHISQKIRDSDLENILLLCN